MAFNYSRCRSVILQGILAGIRLTSDKIERIAKEEQVNGISLDLVPWHRALGLSLRQSSDLEPEERYCNVEWAYFGLVTDRTCPEMQVAVDFIHEAYVSENSNELAVEMAHLLFLAGAEALLDAKVAMALTELGIDAPICGDSFMPRLFEYMVFDFDGHFPANYCDLVLANRVTARWWSKMA